MTSQGVSLQQSNLFVTLVRGAGAALTIQVVSAAIIYGTQVLLARWMGTAAYGIYNYAIAIGIFWAFIAGLGLPTAVLRFISAYHAQQDWAHLQGMIWGSWWQTLTIGILTAFCGTGILLWIQATHHLEPYTTPLLIGIWTVPAVALMALQKEIIRAFQQIVLAYGPSQIVQPLLLIGLGLLWQIWHELTSTVAIALSLIAAVFTLALQWLLFQQQLDIKIRRTRPAYELAKWWKVALPMVLFGGSHIVLSQTDTLMIGVFLDAKQVGIYGAALKTSLWVPFILASVNAISAPLIAALYARGEHQQLQQLVSTIARWMFYPALLTALGLIVFSVPILKLFGPEFVAARGVLIILMVGQLINVGAGSVGYLLTMTGHQTQSAMVMGISALVNVALNLVGIHLFGIVGAAAATAFSMAIWNIWLYVLVVQYLNVRPSILDALNRRSI